MSNQNLYLDSGRWGEVEKGPANLFPVEPTDEATLWRGDLEPWVQGTPRPENEKRAGHLTCSAFVLMRKMGLEPTRLYKHKILSLACLPIPALPHVRRFVSRRLSYNNKYFCYYNQVVAK